MTARREPYQLLPPLSPDEYAALREDIRGAGVRVPIDVDEQGNILDGHHRKAIADELGVECPERIIRDLPEFAKVDYALSVNLARRHLDHDGKRKLVRASLKRDPRLSDREHARRCGVSHPFVAGLREALESAGQLETVTSRVGGDGRERQLPTQTAGLAGPAPDDEQARIESGTAAAGDRWGEPAAAPQDAPEGDTCESPSGAPQDVPDAVNVDAGPDEAAAVQPAAAPPNHPGDACNAPGEGAGSAPAAAAGGTATTQPPAAPDSSRTEDGFSGEEAGSSAGTGEPAPDPLDEVLGAIDAIAAQTGICPACRRPLEQ